METRIEHDSLGSVKVPKNSLYGAQTQRAKENFPYDAGFNVPFAFIRALALLKKCCAITNSKMGLLDEEIAEIIGTIADSIEEHKDHFCLSTFQTGSGTSTNMNMNEVIGALVSQKLGRKIHANDIVNMSQSSNDVIPSTLHISATLELNMSLNPALKKLHTLLLEKAELYDDLVIVGRTHLMDAMPITMGQQLRGWATQIEKSMQRIDVTYERLQELAIGGTAVGSGTNAPTGFDDGVCLELSKATGILFVPNADKFEAISSLDAVVELHSQLKVVAMSLLKISNDLRYMNSGPISGFSDVALPAVQPGSSIMPGKVNPVIPESVNMACVQVAGNDTAVTMAGGFGGQFQLNVMQPLVAKNVLESISLLTTAVTILGDFCIKDMKPNTKLLSERISRNPILVTALNPIIGYDKGAKIAKLAYKSGRSVIDVAVEETDLSREELKRILDPLKLTKGGLPSSSSSSS